MLYAQEIYIFFLKRERVKKEKKRNKTLELACKINSHCYCGEEDHPNLRTRGMLFLSFNKTKV